MYGSLDVRQFLSHQEEGWGRTSAVPAPRNGETTEFSREQLHRARLAVARGSEDAQDCTLLLDMLGLLPNEDGPNEDGQNADQQDADGPGETGRP